MKKALVCTAVSAAALLAACGGGGGSSSSDGNGSNSTAATVSLSGVAAKGLMANAEVNVHSVKADGSIDPAGLLAAPVLTKADGSYTLTFTGTQGQPYVITVAARADGSTTHADEVSGLSQALPSGFTMRALLVPAASGAVTTSATVTPFSELAVSAAAKASGGVTPGNAAQALSTVSQLLGFDPRSVAVVSSVSGATPEQQKLAVMLASVSQLASDGALGCGTASSAGAKTQCVVDALSASASASSIKLSSVSGAGSVDVSLALSGAVQKVLASSSALASQVPSSVLTAVVANLGCSGTACAAASTGTTPPPNAVAAGIAAAKLMFNDMTSDWRAMFSQGGLTASATGDVNGQAKKFRDAMNAAYVPAYGLIGDTALMVTGVKLYNDYKAGRTVTPYNIVGEGLVAGDGSFDASLVTSGCTVYQDAAFSVPATSPANAINLACGAAYYATRSAIVGGYRYTYYRHAYAMTPNADGSFGWQGRARKTISDCTTRCTRISNDNMQTDAAGVELPPFTGTITPTVTAAGRIDAATLKGDLPAGFALNSNALVGYRQAVSVTASQVVDTASDKVKSATVAGTISAVDSSGAVLSSLTVKTGSYDTTQICHTGTGYAPSSSPACAGLVNDDQISGFALDIRFETPAAAVQGVVSAGTSAWDRSGTQTIPTQVDFTGTFSTIAAGTSTDFFVGKVSAKATGYAAFDATKALSTSNGYTEAITVSGMVTAPNRPVLLLSLGASAWTDAHSTMNEAAYVQYKSLFGAKPRSVVNVDIAFTGTSPNRKGGLKLTESVANLAMAWTDGDASAKLTVGGSTEIGSVNMNSGLITYTDGSTTSLDIGL